ncbi:MULTISPECIES: alpha-L-rhamnosidase C-terminal domain-containing protein [Metabacillus]|nr:MULTISPECIES: alpha-L-rhamnosidase C-terminal domain-containing protein [Metabacillus]
MTYARATLQSMYGRIVSAWNITHNEVTVEVEVPVNTTAYITLPNAKINGVKENGIELYQAEGILEITENEDGVQVEVGSGSNRFGY